MDPAALAAQLTEVIAAREGYVRVAVDGAWAAAPHELAESLLEPIRAAGRPATHVQAQLFYRDASVRLEWGHTDEHAFRHDWLDVRALRSEVLDPLGPGGHGRYLSSLRDPVTNRATRVAAEPAEPGQVLLLSGELLLAHGLPFDLSVHLRLSTGALARRTPPERAWTLPAFEGYEDLISPDVEVAVDDPRHPAIRL